MLFDYLKAQNGGTENYEILSNPQWQPETAVANSKESRLINAAVEVPVVRQKQLCTICKSKSHYTPKCRFIQEDNKEEFRRIYYEAFDAAKKVAKRDSSQEESNSDEEQNQPTGQSQRFQKKQPGAQPKKKVQIKDTKGHVTTSTFRTMNYKDDEQELLTDEWFELEALHP